MAEIEKNVQYYLDLVGGIPSEDCNVDLASQDDVVQAWDTKLKVLYAQAVEQPMGQEEIAALAEAVVAVNKDCENTLHLMMGNPQEVLNPASQEGRMSFSAAIRAVRHDLISLIAQRVDHSQANKRSETTESSQASVSNATGETYSFLTVTRTMSVFFETFRTFVDLSQGR